VSTFLAQWQDAEPKKLGLSTQITA
jgi:hypothetical protein